MQITKEYLERRLAGLHEQQARLQADLDAVAGATQVVEQLIAYDSEPESAPEGT